jgi:hypothetical protein
LRWGENSNYQESWRQEMFRCCSGATMSEHPHPLTVRLVLPRPLMGPAKGPMDTNRHTVLLIRVVNGKRQDHSLVWQQTLTPPAHQDGRGQVLLAIRAPIQQPCHPPTACPFTAPAAQLASLPGWVRAGLRISIPSKFNQPHHERYATDQDGCGQVLLADGHHGGPALRVPQHARLVGVGGGKGRCHVWF